MKKMTKFSLTNFQRKCLSGLVNLISANGGKLVDTEILGIKEIYIKVEFALLDTLHATAWIYEDECALDTKDDTYHFEKPDFDNLEELEISFLDLVSSLLRREEPRFKGSNWISLFRCGKL